jgi:hypothetical protein
MAEQHNRDKDSLEKMADNHHDEERNQLDLEHDHNEFHKNDHHHEDHEHHHHSHHYDGGIPMFPFFRMIRQRQRWGEKQSLPHGDFSDTFFDLFYVAAAYNLGNILKAEPSNTGILYFLGCFLPLQTLWFYKTYFDARFYFIVNDFFHECFDMAGLLALSTAVLHIRPVAILSNLKDNIDMFILSLSISLSYFFHIIRLIEIMISQKVCEKNTKNTNDKPHLYPESFGACRRDIVLELIPFLCSVLAAIYSGLEFYGKATTADSQYANTGYVGNKTNNETISHRLLGDEADTVSTKYTTEDNVPIWLLLGGIVGNTVAGWFFYWYKIPRNPNRKEYVL